MYSTVLYRLYELKINGNILVCQLIALGRPNSALHSTVHNHFPIHFTGLKSAFRIAPFLTNRVHCKIEPLAVSLAC